MAEVITMGGTVRSVNGKTPDDNGNVSLTIGYSTKSEIVDLVYPVGSLYWSSKPTSPATLFGGTWVQIKDKFILAAGDSYAQGATGGEATHTLTVAEMPSHNHSASSNSTGAHSHELTMGYNVADGTGWGKYLPGSDRKLTTNTAGAHSHTITVNNRGSGNAHNNMPPYVTYYCWERTA